MITIDLADFIKATTRTEARAKQAAVNGMHDAMDDLLRRSRDLAPLKKGTLRLTSWSEVAEKGGVVEGAVYYSATEKDKGGAVNYALITHEMDTFKNPTTPGTQPKYLEQPFKENVERYKADIAEAIRKELK